VAFAGDTLTERGEDAFAVMADVLLAYPTMRVRVDLTDVNPTRLSARAAAVRRVLAREGVTEARVAVRVALLPAPATPDIAIGTDAPVTPTAPAPDTDARSTRVAFSLVDPSAPWPPDGQGDVRTDTPPPPPPPPGSDTPTPTHPVLSPDATWMPAPTEELLAPPPTP
jgi:hypothetical protein